MNRKYCYRIAVLLLLLSLCFFGALCEEPSEWIRPEETVRTPEDSSEPVPAPGRNEVSPRPMETVERDFPEQARPEEESRKTRDSAEVSDGKQMEEENPPAEGFPWPENAEFARNPEPDGVDENLSRTEKRSEAGVSSGTAGIEENTDPGREDIPEETGDAAGDPNPIEDSTVAETLPEAGEKEESPEDPGNRVDGMAETEQNGESGQKTASPSSETNPPDLSSDAQEDAAGNGDFSDPVPVADAEHESGDSAVERSQTDIEENPGAGTTETVGELNPKVPEPTESGEPAETDEPSMENEVPADGEGVTIVLEIPESLSVRIGESVTIPCPGVPEDVLPEWSCEPEGIVSIQDNTISALRPGEAVVRVRAGEETAFCRVTVPAPEIGKITLPSKIYVGVKESIELPYTLFPEYAEGELSFKFSSKGIAAIDESAVLTGKKAGTVTVTVQAAGGVKASCKVYVRKAPSKVTLSAAKLTLAPGMETTLKAKLTSDSSSQLSWISTAPEVVSVTDGKVTAVSPGSAVIQVRTFNGKTASAAVEVLPRPTCIEMEESFLLAVGMKVKPSIVVYAQGYDTCLGDYTIVSDQVKIVQVSGGTLTAKKVGTAHVTVQSKADPSLVKVCEVTVVAAPKKVKLNKSSATLGVGDSFSLTADVTPVETVTKLTWSSNNPKVASVDQNGLVSAIKAGSARITVKTFNGISASFSVTVKKQPTSIRLNTSELVIPVGACPVVKATLNSGAATRMDWSSGNPSVVSVSDDALRAESVGETDVTVVTSNGLSAGCHVIVRPAPEEITVLSDAPILAVGMKTNLHWGYHPREAIGDAKIINKNTKVVKVASDGRITALKAGTAEIQVEAFNGCRGSVLITVVSAPSSIRLNTKSEKLKMGERFALEYTLSPAETIGAVTFTSSNPKIAAVDENGIVTAIKPGKVTITARVYNGRTASCRIQVKTYEQSLVPELVAHRGEGTGYPENSLEAFRAAIESGEKQMETDVWKTADGVLVLCHDATVDRTSDGKGRVDQMTYEELMELDFGGTKIATLGQLLELAKGKDITLHVELKGKDVVDSTVELVRNFEITDQIFFCSYDYAQVNRAKQLLPEARCSYLTNSSSDIEKMIKNAVKNQLDAIVLKYSGVKESIARKIHEAGLKLGTFTVNDSKQLKKIEFAGADWVITDKASEIRPILWN